MFIPAVSKMIEDQLHDAICKSLRTSRHDNQQGGRHENNGLAVLPECYRVR